MNWFKFAYCALFLNLATCSIPEPMKGCWERGWRRPPTFEEYFRHVAKLLRDQSELISCPYPVARMILTLYSYEVPDEPDACLPLPPGMEVKIVPEVKPFSYDEFIFGISPEPKYGYLPPYATYKYTVIMEEMSMVYDSMNPQTRHTHLDGLKFMLSTALTSLMIEEKDKSHVVIKFFNEALISKNPLNIFNELKPLSLDSDLLKYDQGDDFPVYEIYGKLIRDAVVHESRRLPVNPSCADLIDWLVLIYQYFRSMDYKFCADSKIFRNCEASMAMRQTSPYDSDIIFQKIVHLAIEYPELVFSNFLTFFENSNDPGSPFKLYKAIYKEKWESALDQPFAKASFVPEVGGYMYYIKGKVKYADEKYWKSFINPETLDELRLFFVALSTANFDSYMLQHHEYTPQEFFYAFLFHAFSKATQLFPTLVESLFQQKASVILNEISQEIFAILRLDGRLLTPLRNECEITGLTEAVKLLR